MLMRFAGRYLGNIEKFCHPGYCVPDIDSLHIDNQIENAARCQFTDKTTQSVALAPVAYGRIGIAIAVVFRVPAVKTSAGTLYAKFGRDAPDIKFPIYPTRVGDRTLIHRRVPIR